MIPTEHEYTVATHAAARAAFDAYRNERIMYAAEPIPEWDDLPVAIPAGVHGPSKQPWLERVLPTVDAAISAIPDRALGAWERGFIDAYAQERGQELPTPAARYDLVRHLLDLPDDDGKLPLEKWNPYR